MHDKAGKAQTGEMFSSTGVADMYDMYSTQGLVDI